MFSWCDISRPLFWARAVAKVRRRPVGVGIGEWYIKVCNAEGIVEKVPHTREILWKELVGVFPSSLTALSLSRKHPKSTRSY